MSAEHLLKYWLITWAIIFAAFVLSEGYLFSVMVRCGDRWC